MIVRKRPAILATIIICLALMAAAPLSSYAHETSEENEGIITGHSSTFATTDALVHAENNNDVTITPKTNEHGIVTLRYHGITTFIKGIPRSISNDTLKKLALHINMSLQSKSSYKVTHQAFTDAEKYSTEPPRTYEQGYDALLCWAAGASNMLWMSGYAQKATNPLTKATFKNEDDVFNFFRKSFADYGGNPDGALEYFLKGTYKYSSERVSAQVRDDAPKGGMLKSLYGKAGVRVIQPTDKRNMFASLNNLQSVSCSAVMRYYSTESKLYDGGAHVVTICGVVIDESANEPTKRYKGIILADSDNDAVITNGFGKDPAQIKAKKAAQAPNSYTFYPLSWETVDKEGQWVIGKYLTDSTYKAIIESLTLMNDLSDGSSHKDDPKHEHSPVIIEGYAPTCTESGKSDTTICALCGAVIQEHAAIPAKGHKWSNWKIVKKATSTEPGLMRRICMNDPHHVQTKLLLPRNGIDINNATFNYKTTYTYTGKSIEPIKVFYHKKKLKAGKDYAITYKKNKNAGQAIAIIKGIGKNKGSKIIRFAIAKAPNPLTVKTAVKRLTASKLTKNIVFDIGTTKAQGDVTYTLNSKAKRAHLRVTSQGSVIIPKNCKKGVYFVNIKASGNANYKAGHRVVKIVVK